MDVRLRGVSAPEPRACRWIPRDRGPRAWAPAARPPAPQAPPARVARSRRPPSATSIYTTTGRIVPEEWDALVERTPGTDVTQLSAWARVRASAGFSPLYVHAHQDGKRRHSRRDPS